MPSSGQNPQTGQRPRKATYDLSSGVGDERTAFGGRQSFVYHSAQNIFVSAVNYKKAKPRKHVTTVRGSTSSKLSNVDRDRRPYTYSTRVYTFIGKNNLIFVIFDYFPNAVHAHHTLEFFDTTTHDARNCYFKALSTQRFSAIH